ncbi:MAG TPA: hypothetical protein VEA69_08035 [Tepidisphaeraceae bacterium]|nr:hypothetical protein [Tepidisphaeraceae bacterium]
MGVILFAASFLTVLAARLRLSPTVAVISFVLASLIVLVILIDWKRGDERRTSDWVILIAVVVLASLMFW